MTETNIGNGTTEPEDLTEIDVTIKQPDTVSIDTNGQAMFYARGKDGKIIMGSKNEVFQHSTEEDPEDSRAYWPINQRIPEDPDRAAEISENRDKEK